MNNDQMTNEDVLKNLKFILLLLDDLPEKFNFLDKDKLKVALIIASIPYRNEIKQ